MIHHDFHILFSLIDIILRDLADARHHASPVSIALNCERLPSLAPFLVLYSEAPLLLFRCVGWNIWLLPMLKTRFNNRLFCWFCTLELLILTYLMRVRHFQYVGKLVHILECLMCVFAGATVSAASRGGLDVFTWRECLLILFWQFVPKQ